MEEKTPQRPARHGHLSVRILDRIDAFFYMLVGIAFLGAAGLTLIYSVINLVAGVVASVQQPTSTAFSLPIAQNVLSFISDLLLVLIILEVLGTIRSYLDKRSNSVQPFLFIGIISATRSILSAGAQLSITLSSSGSASISTPLRERRHSTGRQRRGDHRAGRHASHHGSLRDDDDGWRPADFIIRPWSNHDHASDERKDLARSVVDCAYAGAVRLDRTLLGPAGRQHQLPAGGPRRSSASTSARHPQGGTTALITRRRAHGVVWTFAG